MTDTVAGPFQLRQRIQILRTARKLVKSGDITPGMSKEDIQDAIMAAMADDDPAMLEAGFDWQKLIDLIIQLLPLIMKLFGL
jgi:hypothetical protein